MESVRNRFDNFKASLQDHWSSRHRRSGGIGRLVMIVLALLLLLVMVLAFWWSSEPDIFDVRERAEARADDWGVDVKIGFTTTNTLLELSTTLLEKPGGYLSNDITLPGIWLDNIPNWEFGVLVQIRDFSRALRKDFSRSQSQSTEDADLAIAEPQFHFDHRSWALPSSESEYRRANRALEQYLRRLADDDANSAQFYARADNLRQWLFDVETRLGSLSQRLSASVGQRRVNTDLSGDIYARQSTPTAADQYIKTPWLELDDVFYEARGTTWALLHLLKAIEVDFREILVSKNALVSLRQIIRELEATQESLSSPMILNGSGFGVFANHSLVMASYISRANAAIIDLRGLLSQG
ncbi:MAG: DUF2333 family protein [Bacterioplanes sp.]|nr:DUF2333 family protein [Bacterioplanes sp.]